MFNSCLDLVTLGNPESKINDCKCARQDNIVHLDVKSGWKKCTWYHTQSHVAISRLIISVIVFFCSRCYCFIWFPFFLFRICITYKEHQHPSVLFVCFLYFHSSLFLSLCTLVHSYFYFCPFVLRFSFVVTSFGTSNLLHFSSFLNIRSIELPPSFSLNPIVLWWNDDTILKFPQL